MRNKFIDVLSIFFIIFYKKYLKKFFDKIKNIKLPIVTDKIETMKP